MKLSESIDLLLAAGYFRARIKGLSPFDKVCESVRMHLASFRDKKSATLSFLGKRILVLNP